MAPEKEIWGERDLENNKIFACVGRSLNNI